MRIRRSPRTRHVSLLAAVTALILGAGVLVLTDGLASASVAPTRIRAAMSGVGYADRAEWGAWRGLPVQTSATWNDPKDSNGAMLWPAMNALYTVHEYYSDGKWNGTLSLAQPMYASNQNVNSCASTGEINAWTQALRAAWTGNTYIRLAWEFNGDWYTWKRQPGNATAFKNCWIRWYDGVKAVDPNLKLVWNPNFESSNGSLNVTDFWPGAEYVDAAGPDNYARNDNGDLRSPDKTGSHGEPIGIYAWQEWVAQKGVPFAVPEWGINDYDAWGSIDPEFITQMRTAFERAARSPSGLAYEDYFDGSTAFNCKFSLHDAACGNVHPTQAARYKSLFNRPYDTGTTPPSTPPSTPSSTPPVTPPSGDIAQGKPVAASSGEPSGFEAAKAVDGNPTTRWSTAYSDPQWISVDLGQTYAIARVRINWETAYGRAYQVQTSNDNTNWTPVYSTTTGNGGVDDLTVSGTGRWLRVYGTQRATQ